MRLNDLHFRRGNDTAILDIGQGGQVQFGSTPAPVAQNSLEGRLAGDVSGHTYDYIVKLVREYGVYPLDLGEFDEPVTKS